MTSKTKKYLILFISSFYISAVTFGSGYVIVSVIKKRFVDELKWIEEEEMLNLITLAQSSPGVLTANTALLVGYKVCGKAGAFLAVLGVALPPLITIYIISIFYNILRENVIVSAVIKGIQAGACAVICDVTVGLFTNAIKGTGKQIVLKIAIMISTFVSVFILHVNAALIILFFIFLGLIWYFCIWEKGEIR